jgi:hypothetical protein
VPDLIRCSRPLRRRETLRTAADERQRDKRCRHYSPNHRDLRITSDTVVVDDTRFDS